MNTRTMMLFLLATLALLSSLSPAAESPRVKPVENKPSLNDAARVLRERVGGIWRKLSQPEGGVGEFLSCQVAWKDDRGMNNVAFYAVFPGTLDDAGKARAFVFSNMNPNIYEAFGCNDHFMVLATDPARTPEISARIRNAFGLKDPGFRIRPQFEERKELKTYGIATDVEQLQFEILYYGEKDKPQAALTLSVPKLSQPSTDNWPKLNITSEQAQKLLDAINKVGPFGACSACVAGHKPSNMSRATLVLRGYLKGVDQYSDLDAFEPAKRDEILAAIRNSLSGEPAKAMDGFLAHAPKKSPNKAQ